MKLLIIPVFIVFGLGTFMRSTIRNNYDTRIIPPDPMTDEMYDDSQSSDFYNPGSEYDQSAELYYTDTNRFDPILVKVMHKNNQYVLTDIIESSDSCTFHITDPETSYMNLDLYGCSRYDELTGMLKKRNIHIKTMIYDSLEGIHEKWNDELPAFCTFNNNNFNPEALEIEFPGFRFNFMDQNIYSLCHRQMVDQQLFGVFNHDNSFVIAHWDLSSRVPVLGGFAGPLKIITLPDFFTISEFFRIDSAHYIVTGHIPEIDYLDGPSRLNNYGHTWIGILKFPGIFYFLSTHGLQYTNEKLTLEKEFRTFYSGEDDSHILDLELHESQIIVYSMIGLCDEEAMGNMFSDMDIPEEELEGIEIECPLHYEERSDTLDINVLKDNLLKKTN